MPITHRFKKRQEQLQQSFQKKELKKLWKEKVKSQVRSMSVQDLHDYYDFHRRLDENVSKIEEMILSGQYKTQNPLVYTLEKKLGICRHMIIPSPSDTLVLQALITPFSSDLEKSSPSKQAYYSRDKNSAIKLPHEIFSDYEDWFSKWKIYQKEILHFTNTKQYIITTDLSNYYDSIRLKELRSVISGHISNCPEVSLDLIFEITESLSWRPDYLPSQFIGLPVINLESIRLLAHAFLFEVDTVLKQHVDVNFVRWMDDIIIGVNDIDEAKRVLKNVSDVLKSRGLALNMAKTHILTSEDAKKHFLFDENIKLNHFCLTTISEKEFMKAFKEHLKNNKKYRYYDKVLKRYITLAGDKKFKGILKYLPQLFEDFSGLRSNICSYLYKLGFSTKTAKMFWDLINIKQYDDMTLFSLITLTTDWNINISKTGKEFIKELLIFLKKLKLKEHDFNFYNYLWCAAKYEKPSDLYLHLEKFKNFWIKNPFLTRQVAAILPRLKPSLDNKYEELSNFIMQHDYNDCSSVIYNMNEIRSLSTIKYLKEYLFPNLLHKKGYPLAKFLILYNHCLGSVQINNIDQEIQKHINDKWFLHWLNE